METAMKAGGGGNGGGDGECGGERGGDDGPPLHPDGGVGWSHCEKGREDERWRSGRLT